MLAGLVAAFRLLNRFRTLSSTRTLITFCFLALSLLTQHGQYTDPEHLTYESGAGRREMIKGRGWAKSVSARAFAFALKKRKKSGNAIATV